MDMHNTGETNRHGKVATCTKIKLWISSILYSLENLKIETQIEFFFLKKKKWTLHSDTNNNKQFIGNPKIEKVQNNLKSEYSINT